MRLNIPDHIVYILVYNHITYVYILHKTPASGGSRHRKHRIYDAIIINSPCGVCSAKDHRMQLSDLYISHYIILIIHEYKDVLNVFQIEFNTCNCLIYVRMCVVFVCICVYTIVIYVLYNRSYSHIIIIIIIILDTRTAQWNKT